jgi:hypothetical protein
VEGKVERLAVEGERHATEEKPPSRVESRLVISALRTTQQTLVQFSAMADHKANMMITVCSIVLTLGITQLGGPLLRWPLLMLTVSTLVALMLAILAVLPAAQRRGGGPADPRSPGFNLLFFGHFAELPLERFEEEMEQLLRDDYSLLATTVRDIHAQGLVLARKKYRLLRRSYEVFLVGVVVTVLFSIWEVFVVAS